MRSPLRLLAASFLFSFVWAAPAAAQVKENLDLPYDAIGESEDEEDAPEVVTFYGQNYEGDGFFYVVDRSRSMQDRGELPIAQREVVRNITEFNDRVKFGINFFDRNLYQFPSNGQATEASPGMRSSAIAFVQSQNTGGSSCCQKGLMAGLRMANTCTARRKVLVYVGDGGGTCEGQNEAEYLRQTLAAVTTANFNRIQINTIGVLDVSELGEQFLRNLAAQNSGTYVRINR